MRREELITSKHLDLVHRKYRIKRYIIPTGNGHSEHSPHIEVSWRRLRAWLRENPRRWGFIMIDSDLFEETTASITSLHCPGGYSTL